MADAADVSGIDRAAILLFTLGEEAAASILRHMDIDDVHRLGSAMASLENIPKERVSGVLGDMLNAVEEKTPIGIGTKDFLQKILHQSLGDRKAGNLLGRIFKGRKSQGIESLRWMDSEAVARVIGDEHPQIIATILAHFGHDQAAAVLKQFPIEQRAAIALRIARLDTVSEDALKELDAIVEEQTQAAEAMKSTQLGGVRSAADIINHLDSESESAILDVIRAEDTNLLEAIENSLFVFEALLSVDDRGIQTIMREIQSDTLILALKGADEAMRTKIFDNMSKRAAETLRDDLSAKGPVRVADVEQAQREILVVAQRLSDEGQIVLGGSGDDYV